MIDQERLSQLEEEVSELRKLLTWLFMREAPVIFKKLP